MVVHKEGRCDKIWPCVLVYSRLKTKNGVIIVLKYILTLFSVKMIHSSSLLRRGRNPSEVIEKAGELSRVPIWSSSVKYASFALMLSAKLTSFI